MYINYPVGDFLIRIKNMAMRYGREVEVPYNAFIEKLALLLKEERILDKIEKKDGTLVLTISYHKKRPILIDLKIISKPGLRVYKTSDQLAKHKGSSVLLVSTSKGILSHRNAIKKRLGGEIICEIW